MSTSGDSTARVHDLGYKRYQGDRRPQSTRYRTIMRKVVSSAWRGWWRVKLWIIGAAITTVASGTVMYLLSSQLSEFFRGGSQLPLGDALVPLSFQFYKISALVVSLTVLSSMVANDLRTGAFEFYFSRPLRPVDYVMGKIGGAVLLMGMILFVGPMLLALFRTGLMGSDGLAESLGLLAKTAAVGALSTLVYATLPLGFSALSSRRRNTIVAWAGFYFIVNPLIEGIALGAKLPALRALNFNTALQSVTHDVFDVTVPVGPAAPPTWLALASVCGYVALSVAFVSWRVAAAERAGLGGG